MTKAHLQCYKELDEIKQINIDEIYNNIYNQVYNLYNESYDEHIDNDQECYDYQFWFMLCETFNPTIFF